MNVLFVDRVTVFGQIIAGELAETDIRHTFAGRAKEALALLEKQSFQCICVSLYLPDDDGINLCSTIRAMPAYRHTPVVLLTTQNYHDICERAFKAGISDIFAKDKIHELIHFIQRFGNITKPLEGRILYIEDQRAQRELVTTMLTERGLVVDAYEDGDDGWAAFLQQDYQLVLTDIVLGGMTSGVMLINRIRRLEDERGDVPILALTAFDEVARRISLFHFGVSDYVTKPVIGEELTARIRNLMEGRQAIARMDELQSTMADMAFQGRATKMAALGLLTGGIAHEFNNLLGIIGGFAGRVLQQTGSGGEIGSQMTTIVESTAKATELTRKLLAFSSTEVVGPKCRIDVDSTLSTLLRQVQRKMDAGIEVVYRPAQDIWPIDVESKAFEQAVTNLFTNAKEAMDGKGVILLSLVNRTLGEAAAMRQGLNAGEYVLLAVKDSGVGIEEAEQDRIFDPFFTTKGHPYRGLGLSQVYGMVHRCGGAVAVYSRPGQGTLFQLHFPRANDKTVSAGADHSNCPQLLVVDEEPLHRELLKDVLTAEGYLVETSDCFEQAMEKLDEGQFRLLLTDAGSSSDCGTRLARRAKASHPGLKVILMGVVNPDKSDQNLSPPGWDHQMKKPLRMSEMVQTIGTLLEINQ